MDFGTGMGSAARNSSVMSAAGTATSFYSSAEYLCNLPYQVDNQLRVDDLLNFSCNDASSLPVATTATNHHVHHCDTQFMDASSCFQSPQGPLDLYIPCEEAAELEWLSRFVDESFSDRISNSYQYAGAILPTAAPEQHGLDDPASAVPSRGARSKRPESASVTGTPDAAWTTSLLRLPAAQSSPSSSSSSSSTDFPTTSRSSIGSNGGRGKKGGGGNADADGGVRRCTHCASEKTPQWRTGPLGPKTLCNACGVRYKSGRLVPEYRPAASPTFVLTQHSNSHRKVMELRRQKELLLLNNAVTPSVAAAWPELHFADCHQQQQNGVC